MTYDEAIKRIEQIVSELEQSDALSMDSYQAKAKEAKELLVPIFIDGKLVYECPETMDIQAYCKQEKETLWDETKRLSNPHRVYVDLSQKLYDEKQRLLNEMSVAK